MDEKRKQELIARAHSVCRYAENDYQAVDSYCQEVYRAIRESRDENSKAGYAALENDYRELTYLRTLIFQEEVERMSNMNVIGVLQ